jgi:hypothetical protein
MQGQTWSDPCPRCIEQNETAQLGAVVHGLPELETDANYHRGVWMPHVTLAQSCHSPERAIAAAAFVEAPRR